MPRAIAAFVAVLLLVTIFCLMIGIAQTATTPKPPTIIKVIDLGEHPYVGFPGYGDGMAFAGPEANWTYVMRVWSDGTCEIARLTFWEGGTWSMTEWTHPSLEE